MASRIVAIACSSRSALFLGLIPAHYLAKSNTLSGVQTAFTWKRLRRRLVKMLVVTTGTPAPRHWTLTVLSHAAGSTPDKAWSRLRIFESVGSRAGTLGWELV